MLAVVIRYWRDCLVLVREGVCEGKRVVWCGNVREEMWLYNREMRRGGWILTAERFREVAAREQNGKLRSPSLGLHNLQADDKTGYCVIKQLLFCDSLPM